MYHLKSASDFRAEARSALRGNWWIGALTALAASFLGASTMFNAATIGDGGVFRSVTENLGLYPESQRAAIVMGALVISAIVFVINLAIFIIAGPISFGYINFNMKMLDGEKPRFKDLFSEFKRFKDGFSVIFFRWLFVLLWAIPAIIVAVIIMLLFSFLSLFGKAGMFLFMVLCFCVGVAAGIFIYIKMLDYALASYVSYEYPGIGGREALRESKLLIKGNKGRLFGLTISFIGWNILSQLPYIVCMLWNPKAVLVSLPFCIGAIWVKAYMEVAYMAFYRQMKEEKNAKYRNQTEEYENKLEDVDCVVEQSRWNY